MSDHPPSSWRGVVQTVALVLAISLVGVGLMAALWYRHVLQPQVVFLGSGDRLSVLVTDGPARLLIATGDDPTDFENAFTAVQPLFARRVDVLLVAGDHADLLAPLAASQSEQVRLTRSLGGIPLSVEADELGDITALTTPARVRLSPQTTLSIETARALDADPDDPDAWRVLIERGQTRLVVLSDGEAAALFPPPPPASIIAVTGGDPVAGWDASPGAALVAASGELSGPDLRARFAKPNAPEWGFRVAGGEALVFYFTEKGLEVSGESAQQPAPPAASPQAGG
ncbi:MAG: hypothetical protein QM692_00630 [Thermomicrobiales bacterium]